MIDMLLVEDDRPKADRIAQVAEGLLGDAISIQRATSVAAAVSELGTRQFDLMVVDICLPRREGEPAAVDGGLDLLIAHKRLRIPSHIVGLSAFEELVSKHADVFRADLWHLIKFDFASREWVDLLSRKLIHVAEAKQSLKTGFRSDVAILTAHVHPELEAVLALLENRAEAPVEGDPTPYSTGEWRRGGRPVSVVAAAAIEMGMPASACLAMKMIYQWRPRYIVSVGIAAAVAGQLGDILVADLVWDYGSGKVERRDGVRQFSPAPNPIPIDPALRAKTNFFASDPGVTTAIRDGWGKRGAPGALHVRVGPMASGAVVIGDRAAVDEILAHNRKLVGVEMEAYGVFLAARQASEPRPHALCVKAASDFGDHHKSDEYQEYASYAAARFVAEFALEMLFPAAQAAHK